MESWELVYTQVHRPVFFKDHEKRGSGSIGAGVGEKAGFVAVRADGEISGLQISSLLLGAKKQRKNTRFFPILIGLSRGSGEVSGDFRCSGEHFLFQWLHIDFRGC